MAGIRLIAGELTCLSVGSAAAYRPRGPGGPGDPPPGADSDEDEDSDSTAVDLLTAATANNAYSSTKTVSDLLSTLTSILDQAA
jgi:hypothetical protein